MSEREQISEYTAFQVEEVQQQPAPIDPDRPSWGIMPAIGVWLFSHLSPVPFILIWVLILQQRGAVMPRTVEEVEAGSMAPEMVLGSVIATAIGHILTLALCWAVVTRFGSRPFLASLGWHWHGLSRSSRFFFVFGVVAIMFMINIALVQVLPEAEKTAFSEMLKSSNTVRIVVAAMAVLTAPLVEEMVYRGMLYSPLRSRIGMSGSVMIVTVLFALVHIPQYSGAWASLVGLTILSFVLTIIRATTRSILPCVAIHLVFNFVGSIFILRPVLQ
ncbi:MAG TPA: type II CAAX endopeptidase family protein [Blastocatellia bacterium]|nr:type II CAAX endopeptidase family protein [Blastocatellia bacterium]